MAASLGALPLDMLHVRRDTSLINVEVSREWPLDSFFFSGFLPGIAMFGMMVL